METFFTILKKIIPKSIADKMRPLGHYFLALVGALIYRFPSKKIFVVGVTGTKGKSTTVEIVSAILEEAGYKTAIASTVRFKIGKESKPNMMKMTMPGRFFMQKFLRDAVNNNCRYAIIEISSEGVKNSRHKFIDLDALIFTNISPEHIESHGSYENYLRAKLEIAKALEESPKKKKIIVANKDDIESSKFLSINVPTKITYSLEDAKPLTLGKEESDFKIFGKRIISKMIGEFNVYNMLAAANFARSQNISPDIIKRALEKFHGVPGRMEKIEIDLDEIKKEDEDKNRLVRKFPPFTVIVDYAHTADSLEKVYKVFRDENKICVLGSTGGGRDKWKRPQMGAIAEKYCQKIILTNDDPYDDDPEEIIRDIASGIKKSKIKIILDRRLAIKDALESAAAGDVVLITGKGTDPFIMGKNGSKEPWSDKKVTEEELAKLAKKN